MGWHLLALVTMALRHRMLSRSESGTLRALAYLRALPHVLEGWPGGRVIVFDQGPIFLLTRHDVLEEPLAAWRAQTFDTWNALLDVIVVLDAPNAVLVDRINTRSKEHRVKGAPGHAALDFVARSRAVYDEALSRLAAHGSGPAILRFDTSVNSVAEIVDQIIAVLTDAQADPDSGSASDGP